MANYTVYGYIKDSSCNPISGAKVYPYFKKVDSNSPDSKWSTEPYTTDDNGYYSFNLGDDTLLGTEASFKPGKDKIYIAVVYGGSGDKDSDDITLASFYSHTTVNEDSYELNLNIEEKRLPIIDTYHIPDMTLTQTNYTMSESSYADYGWNSDGCYDISVSQKYTYDNIVIFDKHRLTTTTYDWDEIASREVSNNSSDTYKFKEPGDYTVSITVKELWGTTRTVSKHVRIKYNEPVVDFDWIPEYTNNWDGPKLKGQEEITFRNKTTDIDGRLDTYKFKFEIKDKNQDGSDNTDVYDQVDINYQPKKKYHTPGDKLVRLTCYWNDGFEDKVTVIEKTLTIYPYKIIPNFTIDNEPYTRFDEVKFTNTSTGDTDKFIRMHYHIVDQYNKYNPDNPDYGNVKDNTTDHNDITDPTTVIKHKYQDSIPTDTTLTVVYDDGWGNEVTTTITKTINKKIGSASIDIVHDKESIGPVEVTYTPVTTFNHYTGLNINWKFVDVDLDNHEHITERNNEPVDKEQKFTWAYPSRKPFTAVNGASESNPNKHVIARLRTDTGWRDDDDGTDNGGQVYFTVSKTYEAIPYEVTGNIDYNCNIDNHTH